MIYGICIACKKYTQLKGKLCLSCIKELRESFTYGIGGKEVSKKKYDTIMKRGYVIPEEIEGIRLKDEKENNHEKK